MKRASEARPQLEPWLERRLRRHRLFFEDERPGSVLGLICPYTFPLSYDAVAPDRALSDWDFPADAEAFADYEVARLRHFVDVTRDLENDFIPSVTPFLGIGMHSAFFSDAELMFGTDTSWAEPVIHEWADLDRLQLDESNRWYRLIVRIAERFRSLAAGDFLTGTFWHFGPSDMAGALRGNELFTDLYDDPQAVQRLLERSADATIWLEEHLRPVAGDQAGGTALAGAWWIPETIPFMSEDTADLCSPDAYEELFGPATERVTRHFGGGFIHHHARGRHVHPQITRVAELSAVEMSWDPNIEAPIDYLDELIEAGGSMPLQTRCTAAQVYENIETILRGRVILMINVASLEEAADVMRFIRSHSRV
jgi:hypothetical protein